MANGMCRYSCSGRKQANPVGTLSEREAIAIKEYKQHISKRHVAI